MIKKIAWDTFKNTGDINAFLEFKQIETIENQIKQGQNNMGDFDKMLTMLTPGVRKNFLCCQRS